MSGEPAARVPWNFTGKDAITQGADWNRYFSFEYLDPDTGEWTIWNTAGYAASMKIRSSYNDNTELLAMTTNGRLITGIQTVGSLQFCLQITLTAAITAALVDWGIGIYDIKLIDQYGHVTRVMEGKAALSREVTY